MAVVRLTVKKSVLKCLMASRSAEHVYCARHKSKHSWTDGKHEGGQRTLSYFCPGTPNKNITSVIIWHHNHCFTAFTCRWMLYDTLYPVFKCYIFDLAPVCASHSTIFTNYIGMYWSLFTICLIFDQNQALLFCLCFTTTTKTWHFHTGSVESLVETFLVCLCSRLNVFFHPHFFKMKCVIVKQHSGFCTRGTDWG